MPSADTDNEKSSETILSRKLKSILASELDSDASTAEALEELSTFFTDNTLRTRRFLRGDIERRSLQIHQEFLSEFTLVKDAVDDVHAVVTKMQEGCEEMKKQLEETKSKTRDLISQTTRLQTEAETLESNERVVNDFIDRYQLTDAEIAVLKGSPSNQTAAPITQEFFRVLERVQTIHADCKDLLQSGQERTASEIMEQMSMFQESSLERLYRWTQSQCRAIETSDNTVLLAQAMKHLQDRPVMFNYVLDEYCAARKSLLVKSFIDALTVGGVGGTPRPIELHAHEPPRYIGDMLAWLHQAVPGEKENVSALLRACDRVDRAKHAQDRIAAITEDVCRPLKTRVEQILLLEPSAATLYKLTNLIRFYAGTIRAQVTSPTSGLMTALDDLEQLAYTQFLSVLQTTVAQQTGRAETPASGHDLAPTPSTMVLLSLLRETLSGSSVVDERKEQLEEIVAAIVDPLLMSLRTVSSSFPTTDADVFLLNSLYQIHSTLSLFGFNDQRLAALQSDMQLHLDTLSSEQTSNLIANLGLQPICTMVAEQQNQDLPLAKMPGMEPLALRAFLQKFDSFLVTPDVYLLPQARLLVSSGHRKNIGKRSLEVVAASYAQLHAAVTKPGSGYENPTGIMPKTPEQVGLLLQL